MNLMWDIMFRARQCGKKDEDIFFKQAEWCSPLYEQSFPYLNQHDVEDNTVEINALFRFAHIFSGLLHKDISDFPQFQQYIFDAAAHFLTDVDLHHGLSKREFYIRKLMKEILDGGFGAAAVENFRVIEVEKQVRLASLVLSQFQTGASLLYFRKAVLVLFPNAMIYQLRDDLKQILIYLGLPKTETREKETAFLQQMFLPINYQLRIFWEYHFGVIGVDATMQVDEIEIY